MNNIANIIKFKLQQKQWSVAELSRNAEVPIKTLQNILYAGKINVTIQTALKLADVFDCSLDELIDRSQIINHSKQSKEDDVFNQKLFHQSTLAYKMLPTVFR